MVVDARITAGVRHPTPGGADVRRPMPDGLLFHAQGFHAAGESEVVVLVRLTQVPIVRSSHSLSSESQAFMGVEGQGEPM